MSPANKSRPTPRASRISAPFAIMRKKLRKAQTATSRSVRRCSKENGAQGRNRTTDTAIFSRMLYKLSYLGAPGASRRPCWWGDIEAGGGLSSHFSRLSVRVAYAGRCAASDHHPMQKRSMHARAWATRSLRLSSWSPAKRRALDAEDHVHQHRARRLGGKVRRRPAACCLLSHSASMRRDGSAPSSRSASPISGKRSASATASSTKAFAATVLLGIEIKPEDLSQRLIERFVFIGPRQRQHAAAVVRHHCTKEVGLRRKEGIERPLGHAASRRDRIHRRAAIAEVRNSSSAAVVMRSRSAGRPAFRPAGAGASSCGFPRRPSFEPPLTHCRFDRR